MRDIFEIVQSLTKEEKRQFKIFLANKPYKGDQKVLTLFDLVNKPNPMTEDKILSQIYPNGSKNNYYQLKNRLLDDLERTLFLLHLANDDKSKLLYQLGLVKIYTQKLLYKEAYDLLKKMERQAAKKEYHDLLLIIYEEITLMAMEYDAINLRKYLDKQRENIQQYQALLEINQLIRHVVYRLSRSNYTIKDLQLNEELEVIQRELQLKAELLQSPKIQFKIHDSIKRLLLRKQQYADLERYLVDSFADFEKKGLYHLDTHPKKIVNIVWIINSMFKRFRFQAAAEYLVLLKKALDQYNKQFQAKFIWTYYQCQITLFFYSDQCEAALKLLHQLEQENRPKGQPFFDLFIYLNLVSIYYCCKDLSQAMQHIAKLLTNDLYKSLPKELQLRLTLIEILLHYDNEDMLFLEYKIAQANKKFRSLFKEEAYAKDKAFLKIINKCTQQLHPFESPKIKKMVEDYLNSVPPFEPGSEEGISYKIWFRSKLEGKDYYALLLEEVGNKEE